tara:strand:- start:14810 stop:15226 length:417 start_codon:yes stop_codon:yes gene_type:complete
MSSTITETIAGTASGIIENTGAFSEQNMQKFIKLIQDYNVIGFALGIMVGQNVAELANSFIDGIIMPTLEPILAKFGGKKMSVQIGGITFHLGKFFQALLKFLALSIVIYTLLQLGIQMKKPVQWVSIRSLADNVDFS